MGRNKGKKGGKAVSIKEPELPTTNSGKETAPLLPTDVSPAPAVAVPMESTGVTKSVNEEAESKPCPFGCCSATTNRVASGPGYGSVASGPAVAHPTPIRSAGASASNPPTPTRPRGVCEDILGVEGIRHLTNDGRVREKEGPGPNSLELVYRPSMTLVVLYSSSPVIICCEDNQDVRLWFLSSGMYLTCVDH